MPVRTVVLVAVLLASAPALASPPPAEYPGAIWDPAATCNYMDGRDGYSIAYIVVHVMQGSYYGSIAWFQDCDAGASAHYMVRSDDGEITQMVAEADTGWHAGNGLYNRRSIGIEHEGYMEEPSVWFTDAMYQESAALVAYLCDKHGIPKDRNHIIGHDEVPGCPYGGGGGSSCHDDPGPYWDWDYYMSLITGGVTPPATGDLVGFVRETDIYTGADIVGATVSLSTGKSTKTGSNGLYTFTGVAAGAVVITASASGYATGSITRDIVAGVENWGSIALAPVSGCVSHDHLGCCLDDVCWFDSCGKTEESVATCTNGCFGAVCQDCKPTCVLKECGGDGCGGLCGQCFGAETCIGGKCVCVPSCGGAQCGDDGCGGSCGSCPVGATCVAGSCKCAVHSHTGCCGDAVCWYNSCDAQEDVVIACPDGCSEGACLGCEPDCAGKACGADGCGGWCPDLCGAGWHCTESGCVKDVAVPDGHAPDASTPDEPFADVVQYDTGSIDVKIPWSGGDSGGDSLGSGGGTGCSTTSRPVPLASLLLVLAALVAVRLRRRATGRTGS